MATMASAQKRLADLVRQAGQLHLKPEHLREEAEKQLFSEVKLGLLVPAALESEDLVPDDKLAMMRLLLRCGAKKRLTSRAAESLSKILASRSWLKLAQSDATLLGDLRAFSENPEVDGDWKALLDAAATDVAGGTGPTPMALDDESRRLILEPLQEGRTVMASCDWRYTGDVAGEGFAKFLRGVTRLSNSAKGDGGACVPLLDWLDGDWTNLLVFFCSMHEAKRLSRSQVEMCVEKLRSLSVRFAEVEAGAKGLPWREATEPGAPAEAAPPAPPPDGPPPEDSHSLEPLAPPAEAVATVIVPAVPKAVPAVPAVPSPPAAPAAAATVVAGGGYPSGPSAAAKPAAKPAAHPKVFGVKPTVVWVDGNPEAFQTSRLNTERGITFQGFPSPKGGGRPWVSYIQERMVADARVAVAIMNSKHKEDAAEIRKFCEERRVQPPRFIVMCGKRNTPEDVRRDWGMKDLLVVHDWGDAATAALNEVGSAHHSGPTVRAGVEM